MIGFRSPQALIAMIRRVHSSRGRRREGLFSIEGTRLIERALRAGAPLETVLVAERLAASTDPRYLDLFDDLDAAGCSITIISDTKLDELTEGRDLGPILGLVRLPPSVMLSDLALSNSTTAGDPAYHSATHLFLAAVEIVDPGNVGALIRTAHAAGATALLAVGASDPYHPRATRISRGSIFKLPVFQYKTAGELLLDLRQHRMSLIGTTASGGTPLSEFFWPEGDVVILMGNEADGLPSGVTKALDHTITIPMPQGVDSFSVNAAAAIVLYTAAQAQLE